MKIAMVIAKELPLGLVANTAAVLGISLSKMFPQDIVGPDVLDLDGKIHVGITAQTIPVLAGSREQIKNIRDILFDVAYADIAVIDFNVNSISAVIAGINNFSPICSRDGNTAVKSKIDPIMEAPAAKHRMISHAPPGSYRPGFGGNENRKQQRCH